MSTSAEPKPQLRDARAARRGVRLGAGTDGEPSVMNGGGPISPARAGLLIAALLLVTCAANVFSHLHDVASAGGRLAAWRPITWEATSALSEFVACWTIWLALRTAPPSTRHWLRFLVVHGLATVAFCAVHVAGMWALRKGVYALLGTRYDPRLSEVVYEYQKDVLAYAGFAALLWLGPRLTFASRSGPAIDSRSPRQACFDIQEGTRTLRVPIDEILAAHAAGNYVEFLLQDGRRPLMRARLGDVAASLELCGFLRTHRSWVVNLAQVRVLEPVGSGDYQVALEGGELAPVSRRFPTALEQLKARR